MKKLKVTNDSLVLDQPVDQLSEQVAQEQLPTLSIEHKNQILLLQRQLLNLQVTMNQSQKQFDQLRLALDTFVNQAAALAGADANKHTFDLDTLNFAFKTN